jgi:hypothetical protein
MGVLIGTRLPNLGAHRKFKGLTAPVGAAQFWQALDDFEANFTQNLNLMDNLKLAYFFNPFNRQL